MYHYVYCIIRKSVFIMNNFSEPYLYVGVRSSKKIPEDDIRYMESGVLINKVPREDLVKYVIQEFLSRKEANEFERQIVNEQFVDSCYTYNLVEGGGRLKFDEEDVRKMLSTISKKLWQTAEYREKHQNLSYLHTAEVVNKMKDTQTTLCNLPDYRKQRSKLSLELWKDPIYIEKQQNLSYLHTDEVAAKISKANKVSCNTAEFKESKSVQMKGKWQTEEYRAANNLDYLRTNEVKKKISEAAKKQFAVPLVCPQCGKEGRGPWMYQKHFKNCKGKTC